LFREERTSYAACLSVSIALFLQFLWSWYCYGYIRSRFVAPQWYQYSICLVALVVFGGPLLAGLISCQAMLNRRFTIRWHFIRSIVAISIAIVICEIWIGIQDKQLNNSLTSSGEWHQRWFPFGFRSAVYDPTNGWYVDD